MIAPTSNSALDRNTPSRQSIWRLAWPIILANCAAPLLGLVDTAVIGNIGAASDLGGIALGALIFSFLFWAFGFLRMSTSGFVAQAAGAADRAEERAVFQRGCLIATILAVAILLLQWPVLMAALHVLDASFAVESATASYFHIRIWSAPASLLNYVLIGVLIGLGRSRQMLLIQLLLNISNLIFDVYFAAVLGWGVRGIAMGTVLAEWLALVVGLALVMRLLRQRHSQKHNVAEEFWSWPRILNRSAMLKSLSANRDLMIRTLLMLAAFAWFTNQSACYGDVVLASNHILLQFISFSAFFLDGFALAAEGQIGRALGAKRASAFDAAVRYSTELAAFTALILASVLWFFGPHTIALLTNLQGVRLSATELLPFACVYVLVSFAAFQLDGIFIGASQARSMRNASLASVLGFALAVNVMGAEASVIALWLAFIAYVLLRGLSLAVAYPSLRKRLFEEH